MHKYIVACRAIILYKNKILLVSKNNSTWVTPGGILENEENLIECLKREVLEECGIEIEVKDTYYVSEIEDSLHNNKKIEIFFQCFALNDFLDKNWQDKDNVVKYRKWFNLNELENIEIYPVFLKNLKCKKIYKGVSKK